MLKRIQIENLKCFKKQSIPLSELTLLTGFNAAGKSTVIQALLLASQMVRHSTESPYIPLNGPMVKLGTVGDVLNEVATTRQISITFENDNGSTQFVLDASDRQGTAVKLTNHQEVKSDQTLLQSKLRELIYISAMRQGTKDVFPSPDTPEPINADVGNQGQFAPWWFEKHLDDEIEPSRCHAEEQAPTLRRQFNAWAAELFPGSQANARKIPQTPLVQLELRTKETEGWRRPVNIGYGLTYAFPILVAGLLAKPNQILIVDSPEAHLHPLGQSRIGEFLSTVAASGVQVILETHSDHVLNGVRLAVARNKISNTNTVIHFFSPDLTSAQQAPVVVSPQVDREGNLSEWPEGFFDQSEKDMTILAGWE